MSITQEGSDAPEVPLGRLRGVFAAAVVAALVALGDALFFLHPPGISLTIFFLALIGAVIVVAPTATLLRSRTLALGTLAMISALPFAESDDVLWIPMALGAVGLFSLAAAGALPRYEDWPGAAIRFGLLAPFRLASDLLHGVLDAQPDRPWARLLRLALSWVIPIGLAAVFALLFVIANPLLEEGFHAIRLETIFQLLDPRRVILWGLVAATAWPLLVPRLLVWPKSSIAVPAQLPRAESVIFGAAAVRNALVLFNLLFAVQTVMDIAFLWAGLRLPDGMSHAEYAHRGAYPLIATALLAALFVLVALRPGGAGEKSPLIRVLVYLWIAQNVWLVISSILRLELYVETYSLTELRLAAGIWMGLVAVGLVLILARIALGRSNRWLVSANLSALALTLLGCAFLNVPAMIAQFNVGHSWEVTGEGQPLDLTYMTSLGPDAIPALDQLLITARNPGSDELKSFRLLRNELTSAARLPADWQGWTWRRARLANYVLQHPFAPEPRDGK